MGPYLGDIAEDAVIGFMWDTNGSNGASITRTADGVIKVYKANSIDEVTVPTGITDTEDFDGITGVHHCSIDTSANAFYATGNDYTVVLTAATIDTQTVNAVLATFSIENRFTEVDLTKILGHLLTNTGTQVADAFQTFFDVATPTGTVNSLPGAAPDAAGGLPISDAGGLDMDNLKTDLDTITGADGVTLATAQGLYAPNVVVPDAAGTAAGLHLTTDTLIGALNNPTAAAIATAVMASVIDGTLDVTSVLKLLAAWMPAKSFTKSGDTYIFNDQDGATLATVTLTASGATTVLA